MTNTTVSTVEPELVYTLREIGVLRFALQLTIMGVFIGDGIFFLLVVAFLLGLFGLGLIGKG